MLTVSPLNKLPMAQKFIGPSCGTSELQRGWRCYYRESAQILFLQKITISRRSVSYDPVCVLCEQENETSHHIFFKCLVTWAIWYSSCRGFKLEKHQIMDCEDIIKIILTPPKAYCPVEDQWLIPLNMAFVIDEIWYLWDQVLNHCAEINIEESFKRIKHKLNEHSALFTKGRCLSQLGSSPSQMVNSTASLD